jgi:hypothetical protein
MTRRDEWTWGVTAMLATGLKSGNLELDGETGTIYRHRWTPLEDGDREWAGRDPIGNAQDGWDGEWTEAEVHDWAYLVDLWEDGERGR